MTSAPPSLDTRSELRRLGSGGRDDRLHFRLVVQILLRCLPLLRGVRRHLLFFGGATLSLIAAFTPLIAMGFDVLWTGVLQGNPLPEVQAQLGHSSLSVTGRYLAHVTPEDLAALARRRPGWG